MHLSRVLALPAVALAVALTTSCQSGTPPRGKTDRPRVAFVSNNPDSFWTIAEAGTKKAASEFDVEVYFRKPAQGDAAVQKEFIDTLLNQGIKAIAISVIGMTALNPSLKHQRKKRACVTGSRRLVHSPRFTARWLNLHATRSSSAMRSWIVVANSLS